MPAPQYRATPGGIVAVTPDGQIIQAGSYSYKAPAAGAQPSYKIYQGSDGRLFRSYNPGVHGYTAPVKYPESPTTTGRPEDFRWEWSPQSDYAIWNKANKALPKLKGAAAKTGAGAAAGGGTAGGASGATAGAGGAAGAAGTGAPPDYTKYLASEPTLQAALQQINAAGLTQRSQLVGGEQQLFGRLGEAPDLSLPQYANLAPELRKALQDAVTPELRGVITAGNEAGTSALARLQHTYDVNQSSDVGSLISRNMIHSGELGQRLNEGLRTLTLGQYDTRQAALDTLGTLQNTYLTGQQTLAGQAGTVVSDAQTRAGNLITQGMGLPYTAPAVAPPAVKNPYLAPAVPNSVARPVTVGATTGLEPHATAGNIIPQAAPMAPKPAAPKAAPYKPPSLGFRALR